MTSVKLSVSVSPDDVARLDRYAQAAGLPSRSAAIQKAIGLLADSQLAEDYAAAWDEWVASGDEGEWAATSADGLEVTESVEAGKSREGQMADSRLEDSQIRADRNSDASEQADGSSHAAR